METGLNEQLESLLFFMSNGKLMIDAHSCCWLQPPCALGRNKLNYEGVRNKAEEGGNCPVTVDVTCETDF